MMDIKEITERERVFLEGVAAVVFIALLVCISVIVIQVYGDDDSADTVIVNSFNSYAVQPSAYLGEYVYSYSYKRTHGDYYNYDNDRN